jgi:hypothetical protein
MHKFSRNLYEPPQNSGLQKGDMKQVTEDPQILGATVQTFSCYPDEAPGICVPLIKGLLYIILWILEH